VPLLTAETGISVSENPTFRFASGQSLALPVSVEAVDSLTQAHYSGSTDSALPSAAATRSGAAANASDR
jgi:hypothetical protein